MYNYSKRSVAFLCSLQSIIRGKTRRAEARGFHQEMPPQAEESLVRELFSLKVNSSRLKSSQKIKYHRIDFLKKRIAAVIEW